MKSTTKILSLALALMMTLASCSSSAPAEESDAPASSEEQMSEVASVEATEEDVIDTEKDTLTVAVDREPISLDPPDANVNVKRNIEGMVYDTLLIFDENLEIQPHLAESYTMLDDLTWEFKIREGVTFHNGETLTSKDVLFSFMRQHDMATGKSNVAAFDPAGYQTPDDNTFILKTFEPYAFTEQLVASNALGIVNEKTVTEMGDDAHGRAPIGTGPYMFDSWLEGSNITLKRNDNYWGDVAKMENIVFRIITESATRTIELEAGGVDINLTVVSSDADRIDENPDTQLLTIPSLTMRYIAFNTQKAPFDNLEVRQAFAHATDPALLAEIVYGAPKTATAANQPVPPSLAGVNLGLTPYEFDSAKAKQMLADAGYADGIEVEFMYLPGAQTDQMVQILQQMWGEAGITLVLKPMESAALTSALNAGEHQMCTAGTSMGLNDAGEGLNKFFHSKNAFSSSSRSNLSNPEVDAILDQIASTLTADARIPLVEQAQEMIHAQTPLLYICHTNILVGTTNNVRGITLASNNLYRFNEIYLVK